MTHFTVRNLPHKAIYWGNPVNDGRGGFTFDDPVEISCRWEDVSMVEQFNMDTDQRLRSEVTVSQDLDEEGALLLGELIDLDSAYYNDPIAAGASPILRKDKIPSVRGDQYFRKVYIGRLWTGKT